MDKDIHHQYWLLMNPYYCNKWMDGVPYEELLKEYNSNKIKKGVDGLK